MTFSPVGIRCPDHAGVKRGPATKVVRNLQRSSAGRTGSVTATLIAINVGIYFLQLAGGASINASSGWIYQHGALYGPLVAHGDWYRLISAAFLHYGPIHLGMNMLALWWIGRPLEDYLGPIRYLLLYLVSGLAGSAGALIVNPTAVTVGASGAIFGILGAAIVLERQRHLRARRQRADAADHQHRVHLRRPRDLDRRPSRWARRWRPVHPRPLPVRQGQCRLQQDRHRLGREPGRHRPAQRRGRVLEGARLRLSAATAAIETSGLSKTYRGGVAALAGLDLRVEQGEVFGYLGPNGAGKSTTIRLLLDLIRPTAGSAALFGLDSRRDGVAARGRIGYLPGDLRLSDRLTAREQLDSLVRLRGAAAPLRDTLCERLGVELDRPIRELSRGNRQKIGIVQAFMHRPELAVLDEPTSGLDPLLQAEVRTLFRETAADGRTVFLSSHSLDEVQHTADRVGIIRSGRLIDVDRVETLRERALRHVSIVFADHVDPAGVRRARRRPRRASRERLGAPLRRPRRRWTPSSRPPHVIAVVDLVSEPADLEEIFLELYREADDAH